MAPSRSAPTTGSPPLYLQLFQVLRARLEAGRWTLGQTLPPIPALMAEFGTSRVTVRQALALLEAEGIVRRRRGVGTTVERDTTGGRSVTLPTSLEQLFSMFDAVRPKVLEVEHGATLPDVPMPDDETAASSYVRMRRVHLDGDSPYCLIDLALDETIFRLAPRRFRRHVVLSVISQLPEVRDRIASARQRLTIRAADLDEAGHLNIGPGEPVAEVRRTIADDRGVIVYAAVVVYPSRSVRLDMNLLP